MWNVDHIGPFKADKAGFEYILSIRDQGTGFPWFVKCKGKTCEEAMAGITEVASTFGRPIMVKTDQGFGDGGPASLQKALAAQNVPHVTTLPHSPTANSWVEGIRKPLRRALEKYANIHGRDRWSEVLARFAYVLRTTPVPSLAGYSPFELMFGRSPRRGVLEQLTGFGSSGDVGRIMEASVGFRKVLAEQIPIASREQNVLAQSRDKIRVCAPLLRGALVVIVNQTRRKRDLDFRNFPALFLVEGVGHHWCTLSDLAGRDATGRAGGKIPPNMVVPILNPPDAQKYLEQFGGNLPTTGQQLGNLTAAFMGPAPAGEDAEAGPEGLVEGDALDYESDQEE